MDLEKLAELLQVSGTLGQIKDGDRIRAGKISRKDLIRVILAEIATQKSRAEIGRTALVTYLNRNEEKHLDYFRVEAAAAGLTVEEIAAATIAKHLQMPEAD